jgi:hypothetical protein
MRALDSAAGSLAPPMRSGGGVELSGDASFSPRIIRLGFTSMVALGAIYMSARLTTDASSLTTASLAAGWVLMPAILFLSLRFPLIRYALVVPSTLIAVPLLVVTSRAFYLGVAAALGWLLITAGVLLGGLLGVWFWFRWLPVPERLNDPFSRGRWILIGVHVALIVSGLIVVGVRAVA